MERKTRRMTVTEAARNFADIVNRAHYRGETTILMRNGTAVAHIAPPRRSGCRRMKCCAGGSGEKA